MDQNEAKRTMNALNNSNFFQLCTWMQTLRATIIETRPPKSAVASDAAKALGFPVTHSNINSAAKAIGLEWRSATGEKKARGLTSRVYRDRQIAALANAVRRLFAEWNIPLPEGFDEAVAPAHGSAGAEAAAEIIHRAAREAAEKVGSSNRPNGQYRGSGPTYGGEVRR